MKGQLWDRIKSYGICVMVGIALALIFKLIAGNRIHFIGFAIFFFIFCLYIRNEVKKSEKLQEKSKKEWLEEEMSMVVKN